MMMMMSFNWDAEQTSHLSYRGVKTDAAGTTQNFRLYTNMIQGLSNRKETKA